jgi:hypothetical protein
LQGFETACACPTHGREAGTCFGLRNFAGFAVGSGIRQVILLPDNDRENAGSAGRHGCAAIARSALQP